MNEKITVLIVSYNPQLQQLKKTIKSIILQKEVDVEIVLSDDGSFEDYFDEIRSFLETYDFNDVKLIGAKKNQGTCKNIIKGLSVSSGKYVKTIAPGDYLYDGHVLKNWIDFMRNKHIDVSFGDSIYYQMKAGEICPIKTLENPQLCNIYNSQNYSHKKAVLDYIFLKDAPNGASFIATKDLLMEYMSIIEDKIIYAEDMIYRMMLMNGIKIIHYNRTVVLYEFGTGISTSGNGKWGQIISNERKISNSFIIENNRWTGVNGLRLRKCLYFLNNMKSDFVKYIFFPELISMKIKKSINKRYTNCDVNLDFFGKL